MDPVRILALNASPRKYGNTDILSKTVLEAAKARGAVVDSVYLVDRDIRLCTQCEGCHREGSAGCVLDDDFNDLVARMKASDVLVIATPIWWSGVHASLKLLLDRCYSLLSAKWDDFKLRGKGLVVIACQTQGDVDLYVNPLVKEFGVYQDWLGIKVIDSLVASAEGKGEILENAEVMEKARNVGVALANWRFA